MVVATADRLHRAPPPSSDATPSRPESIVRLGGIDVRAVPRVVSPNRLSHPDTSPDSRVLSQNTSSTSGSYFSHRYRYPQILSVAILRRDWQTLVLRQDYSEEGLFLLLLLVIVLLVLIVDGLFDVALIGEQFLRDYDLKIDDADYRARPQPAGLFVVVDVNSEIMRRVT